MKIAIGIDTGGTCTDAVLYDMENGIVLGQGKALTTHDDLKRGILAALDKLDAALCRQAEVAGLSTTLATNACVEGKLRRTRLLLMGIDQTGISRFGGEYGFHDPHDICYLPCRTTITGQVLEEPDWEYLRKNAKTWFQNVEGCAVCEIYGMRNGGILEQKAARILKEETGLSTVCASSLFSGLSSLERGAGALLNAGLLPIMEEFLCAVQAAFSEREIRAELFIVRSDSGLMGLTYARDHAVETLLSGPAASALGGSVLTGENQAVIVDMGGTTTDIALVQNGMPLLAEDGIRVGGWRTQVHGVFASSLALGGDSAIRWGRNGAMTLGPERVIPLCVLTRRYPEILPMLRRQVQETPGHSLPLHEFFVLCRSDWRTLSLPEEERHLCSVLEDGPLSLQQAADVMGVDRYHVFTKTLEDSGIVMRAGLTPTDLMHIRGDYSAYEREASLLGGRFAAASMGVALQKLCDLVYETVSREIFFGIAHVLLEQASAYFKKREMDESVRALLRLQWERRERNETTLLSGVLQTSAVLVGVGGPTHLFLPEAARALRAEYMLPPHASVANAVGAVSGQMTASAKADIRPRGGALEQSAESGCEVLCEGKIPQYFRNEDDAVQWAEESLCALLEKRIRARGGSGKLNYTVEKEERLASVGTGKIYLGMCLQVTAHMDLAGMRGDIRNA